MHSSNKDELLKLIIKMQDSADYLGVDDLQDQYCYKIVARNAYVGVWVKSKNAFLISRYKVDPRGYLFHEYHWDTGEPNGTVKPLELIEKFPFEVKAEYSEIEQDNIIQYLDNLEVNHPLIEGINSLQDRKKSAAHFRNKFTGDRDGKSSLQIERPNENNTHNS